MSPQDIVLFVMVIAVGILFLSRSDSDKNLPGFQPAEWISWLIDRPAAMSTLVGVVVFFGLQLSWQAVLAVCVALFCYGVLIEAQNRPAPPSSSDEEVGFKAEGD